MKDFLLRACVVIRTLSMKISRRRLAAVAVVVS